LVESLIPKLLVGLLVGLLLVLDRLQLGLDILQLTLYIGHVWDEGDFVGCISEGLSENGDIWLGCHMNIGMEMGWRSWRGTILFVHVVCLTDSYWQLK